MNHSEKQSMVHLKKQSVDNNLDNNLDNENIICPNCETSKWLYLTCRTCDNAMCDSCYHCYHHKNCGDAEYSPGTGIVCPNCKGCEWLTTGKTCENCDKYICSNCDYCLKCNKNNLQFIE